MSQLETAIHKALREAQADGWDEGFRAGVAYGAARERYDPNHDPEWCEPNEPRNPYRVAQAEGGAA